MENINRWLGAKCLMITATLLLGMSFNTMAGGREVEADSAKLLTPKPPRCQILTAKQLFDGVNFPQANMAVLIEGDKVKRVGTAKELHGLCKNRISLGDATILPGFIEAHAHITFQNVRKDKVLEHGITTVQDTGGPLMPAEGGKGSLRLLSTGPIIQAEGGYPLNIFTHDGIGGYDKIGYSISSDSTQDEVQEVVQHLVDGGATAIKISLESGGEAGAPWTMPHDGHTPPAGPWPMLSLQQVRWIVAKADELDKRVIAHVGEQTGFDMAVEGGVAELAHMPCAEISDTSLQAAVAAGITFVTTIDTLSSCGAAIHSNTMRLAGLGAKFIYGSEVAHDNVPWGINGEEMHMMLNLTSGENGIDFPDVVKVFKAATSEAGEHLGLAPLGSLSEGAPADIIAVKGNPFERFKLLEYPDLVMSGGKIVVNNFKK